MRATVERDHAGLSVIVGADGEESVLRFTGSVEFSADNDFLLPLLLLPAMSLGAELHLPTVVAMETRESAKTLQDIFRTWYECFTEVSLHTATGPPPSASSPGRGAACFFSGGVDSFFTVLELLHELDTVVIVKGFDFGIGRDCEPDESLIYENLTAAAADLGVSVIKVETDLRQWSDRYVRWADHYVGSALAAVALLLGSSFDRAYIPSTFSYNELFPAGTSPLTDPLWSTPNVAVRQHGGFAKRFQKVQRIGASPIAMRTLRVCWENRDGAYNCGRCTKCIRTMCELWAADALDRCETLPNDIDDARLPEALRVTTPGLRLLLMGLVEGLGNRHEPQAETIRRAANAALLAWGS